MHKKITQTQGSWVIFWKWFVSRKERRADVIVSNDCRWRHSFECLCSKRGLWDLLAERLNDVRTFRTHLFRIWRRQEGRREYHREFGTLQPSELRVWLVWRLPSAGVRPTLASEGSCLLCCRCSKDSFPGKQRNILSPLLLKSNINVTYWCQWRNYKL